MFARFPSLWVMIAILLLPGCSPTSPEVQEMARSYSQRYPEYQIRSISAGKASGNRKAIDVEFDAPRNLKNRGRASLIFDKQSDGSWKCVSEDISMWTRDPAGANDRT
jgi:hypothetical protein